MRQIVLDTETTGLEPDLGHRIIEIGCVEIANRRLVGNHYHQYLQPDREIDAGAVEVHGITNDFLKDKPIFADIADDFLEFIRGCQLIIHNAPFDIGFINHELSLLGKKPVRVESICEIVDTLVMARSLHPGQKNSLDALCRRYDVNNSQRTLHGALLDAEILADVYLAMTGGQASFELERASVSMQQYEAQTTVVNKEIQLQALLLRVIKASDEELKAHQQFLKLIRESSGNHCIWDKGETS